MKKKKLAAWAHIAEIIAAVAVVISLVFVVYSIRQNTAVIRAAADAEMYRYQDEWISEFFTSPELRQAWLKNRRGEALSEEEDYLVFWQLLRTLNQAETMFYRHKDGLATTEAWLKWDKNLRVWLPSNIPEEYWRDYMTADKQEDFNAYVESIYRSQQD